MAPNFSKFSSQKKTKPIYFCITIDAIKINALLDNIDISDFSEYAIFKNKTGEFHITIWFCAQSSDDTVKNYMIEGMSSLLGKEFDIPVRTFSRDSNFGRFDIDIPSELKQFYKNDAQPHITVVYTGKACDAGTFIPTQIFHLEATLRGKVMVAISGNKIVDTLDITGTSCK